jgi:hypothetical protein
MHAGQFRQFGGLVDLAAGAALFVHFLERDQVGFGVADDDGDSLEGELAIFAHTVLRVPTEHAQGMRFSSLGGGHGSCKDQSHANEQFHMEENGIKHRIFLWQFTKCPRL